MLQDDLKKALVVFCYATQKLGANWEHDLKYTQITRPRDGEEEKKEREI